MREIIELDQKQMRLQRMRRNVKLAAVQAGREIAADARRYYPVMLTLTYREGEAWGPRDLKGLLDSIRKWASGHGFKVRYVWVLELTKRGRPHYHVLLWLPSGYRLPKPDKRGWWRWGMTRIEGVRNAVGYMVKYASKGFGDQILPKGARISGSGGLGKVARLKMAWMNLPGYVRDVLGMEHRAVREKGGGFRSRLTGVFVPCPWRCLGVLWGTVFLERIDVAVETV